MVRKKQPKRSGTVKGAEYNTNSSSDQEIDQIKRRKISKAYKTGDELDVPIASRSQGLSMMIGAHVSTAKGVHNAIPNALRIGANAFGLFTQNQRRWANPPLDPAHEEQFRSLCKEYNFDPKKHILPHGSYLVNLAQSDTEKAKQAYDYFVKDLKCVERLGIALYNFHPGNRGNSTRTEAIVRIASQLNRAHKETSFVQTVLENMAGAASDRVIGASFEDFRDIFELIDDKSRIGVCLDTCHLFAAGYDIRTPDSFRKTLSVFDQVVGIKYLRGLHLNDSKTPLGAKRDLHANIGRGFLGLQAFWNVVNCETFNGLPLIVETPDPSLDAEQIKLLESLIGMDCESEEFRILERQEAEKGRAEREKYQTQRDERMARLATARRRKT